MGQCNPIKAVLVGAGNLATNLGVALQETGTDIVQVYSRTDASARSLASRLQCTWTTDLPSLYACADLYIVSLTDDALLHLAKQIVKGREDCLFVHTAGSLPMNTLPCRRRGVLYPMQTFSKNRLVDFSSIPFFIEASSPSDMQMLRTVASQLSNDVFELSFSERQYLHLAAVFCCNFANHCCAMGSEILNRHDIPFRVMLPLIDEMASKLHVLSPHDAQTGPAARGDHAVMDKHLQLLADNPRLQSIYEQMSKSIAHDQL